MAHTDIVPSDKEPKHTAIIPAPGRSVVAQENKNENNEDFILIGEVIDAEVIEDTKKRRKPVEFLAAPQEEPKKEEQPAQDAAKQEDEPQSKLREFISSNKGKVTAGVGGMIVISMLVNTLSTDPPPASTPHETAPPPAKPGMSAQDIIRKYGGPPVTVPTPPVNAPETYEQQAHKTLVLPKGPVFVSGVPGGAQDPNNICIVKDRMGNPVLQARMDTINRLSDSAMRGLFNAAVAHGKIGDCTAQPHLPRSDNPAVLTMVLKQWKEVTPQDEMIGMTRRAHSENKNGTPLHFNIHANDSYDLGVGGIRCEKYEKINENEWCYTYKEVANFNLDIKS